MCGGRAAGRDEAEVGGETAAVIDLLHVLKERAPYMAGFIVLVTFVLLFVAFGSFVLPAAW